MYLNFLKVILRKKILAHYIFHYNEITKKHVLIMLVVDIVRCNNFGRYFLTNSDANVHNTNNQVPEHGMGHDNTLVH